MRRLILILTLTFTAAGYCKVDPPNYHFSLDTLKDFFPNALLTDLEKKYGSATKMSGNGVTESWRYQVAHVRYKFPVIVQSQNGKVVDMFATLPSYFLHDIFHQSLINRFGKQQQYKRIDEEAVYRWDDGEIVQTYSAACTITCFPIFYTVALKKLPEGFRTQLSLFEKQSQAE